MGDKHLADSALECPTRGDDLFNDRRRVNLPVDGLDQHDALCHRFITPGKLAAASLPGRNGDQVNFDADGDHDILPDGYRSATNGQFCPLDRWFLCVVVGMGDANGVAFDK